MFASFGPALLTYSRPSRQAIPQLASLTKRVRVSYNYYRSTIAFHPSRSRSPLSSQSFRELWGCKFDAFKKSLLPATITEQNEGRTMTSDSVGSQWLRPVNSVCIRPTNLPPHPPLWDSGDVATNLDTALEPALKRRKVENQRVASRGGSHSDFAQPWPTLAPDVSSHGRPDSCLGQIGESKVDPALRQNDTGTIRHGPPLFPRRLDQCTSQGKARNPSSAVIKRTVTLGDFEIKPYASELPPSAPRFKHGGM